MRQIKNEDKFMTQLRIQTGFCLEKDKFLTPNVPFKLQLAYDECRKVSPARIMSATSRTKIMDVKEESPDLALIKANLKKKVEKYNLKEKRLEEIRKANKLQSNANISDSASSVASSARVHRGDYQFNRSLLYEALKKDASQRTESDIKDLRLIV